jgi:uncharacterized protein (TIGR04255 family)
MEKKMVHAPVYFTIVQARFNPILALESYAPKIQEILRKQGYPDFEKGILSTFQLNPAAPTEDSSPQLPVAQTKRFTFYNMERTASFVLDENALSYQTTDYDIFKTFSREFLKGLEAVHTAVELSFVERIGVRYLDAIFPRDGEVLANYLDRSLLGLYEKISGNVVHSFSETVIQAEKMNVIARAIIQNGRIGFPPDLLPMTLNVPERFKCSEGKHAILDTDGSVSERKPVDVKYISECLDLIHEKITEVFRAAITEHARDIWK